MRKWLVSFAAAILLAGLGAPSARADLSAAANQKFLADYATQPGVVTRPSGLQYRVKKTGPGTGASPMATSVVVVAYTGKLIDGQVFDRRRQNDPLAFILNQLIPGWIEALQLMKVGDEWEIVLPATLGYGAEGKGASVPPNQTLMFDIELLGIQ